MSIFDTANQDGYHGLSDEASPGPRLGFQDALVASWDAQTKVNSLFAIEKAFGDAEQAQIAKMRAAGLRPHGSLIDAAGDNDTGIYDSNGRLTNPYMDAARSIVDTGQADVNGEGGGEMADRIKQLDAHITETRKSHPELDLKTYGEMFADIQTQARQAQQRDDLPKTFMGRVGSFVGGTAGGLNPVTDPLNTLTLPLGFGKTIAQRMLVQGGLQGVTEGLDIGLSPDTNRLLMGRDLSGGEIAGRIGMAAAGGVLAQGFGEAVGAGLRRATTGKWFHDAPLPEPKPAIEPRAEPIGDTAPLPGRGASIADFPTWEDFRRVHGQAMEVEHVYGQSREAQVRASDDVLYVGERLNRWDGPNPAEIPARTEAASIPSTEPGVRYDKPFTNYIDRMETTDDIARRLDPDLFRLYDLYAGHRAEGRDRLAELNAEPPSPARDKAIEITRGVVVRADERMRDMAPLVSRVYGAAEHEWRTAPVDFATIDFLKRLEEGTGWRYRGEDKPSLTERPLKTEAPAAISKPDPMPLARVSPQVEAKLGPVRDAADRVRANVDENLTAVDEKVTHFVGAVKQVAKMDAAELKAAQTAAADKLTKANERAVETLHGTAEEKTAAADAARKAQREFDELHGVTFPDGTRLEFTDKIAGPEGEMSVRDFLIEMDKDQQALQSVMTCSRPS